MKVKLLQPQRYQGRTQPEGSILTVKDVLAQSWIYKGVADVYSKKTIRKSSVKQDSGDGRTSGNKQSKDSGATDGKGIDNKVQDERA